MKNKQKIIGLIGGMGPYASAYFYELLLKKSNQSYGVKNNDEYPEIVIDSVPVPDFITVPEKMNNAKETLIRRVERLNNFGCTTIAMICNTGHILYEELSKKFENEFVSMVKLVALEVNRRGMKKVGLFATPMTIRSGIYKHALSEFGIGLVEPSLVMQEVHEVIIRDVMAGIKKQSHSRKLENITEFFIKKNSLDGVILGCTELPLVFPKNKFKNMRVIDCLDVLAESLLFDYYKGYKLIEGR